MEACKIEIRNFMLENKELKVDHLLREGDAWLHQ